MELIKDIYRFYCYLSLVDIIFLVAVITLLILIVTLIYFIKINREDKNDVMPINNNYGEDNGVNLNTKIDDLPDDINLLEEYNDEENAILDINSLENKIKEDNKKQILFTDYEKDQEDKAIISYDELVEKHNKYAINYENEEVYDDLTIKKVDLNDLENKNIEDKINKNVMVISYQKEEEFLEALKELNSILN